MGKDQNIIRYYKNRAKKNVLDSRFIGINENGIEYKIYNNLENRYKTIIKNHKLNINGKDLIGCTFNELKKYISKLLINDMTFRNYGEWEIDHIFPLSKINHSREEERSVSTELLRINSSPICEKIFFYI